jgi:hypothetical protein
MRIADDFLLGIYSIFTVYLRRIYRYIFDYSLYFPTLATVLAATHLCWVISPLAPLDGFLSLSSV